MDLRPSTSLISAIFLPSDSAHVDATKVVYAAHELPLPDLTA
jgi:hypothetical protein